ncbi:RpnC/YadD family protein [Virgibacillus ainsalahensis]
MITTTVHEKPTDYGTTSPDEDGLWKKLIADFFEEFMLFFAPELYEEIDHSRSPDFLQQELYKEVIQEKKGRNNADQIVKVFLKNGEERWILIHIEVQGKVNEAFSKRMFRYFYRLYDKFDKEIYAIALLTDIGNTKHTNQFHYSFHGTEVDYTYNAYQFRENDLEKLKRSSNPFAAAVIAGIYASKTRKDADKRYFFKRELMTQLLRNMDTHQGYNHTQISPLIYFIDYLLQIPAFLTKLRDDVTPLLRKEAAQHMQAERSNPSPTLAEIFADLEKEGMEKGKEAAMKQLALELIQENFSDDYIAKLTKLSVDKVEALRKSL